MENPYETIEKLLAAGQNVILARIIGQVGSAPRSIGTACLILEDGSIKGTIGGGCLELQVLEKAKDVFIKGTTALLHFKLTGKEIAQMEMLCGGIVDVYLEPIASENRSAKDLFGKIADLLQKGQNGRLMTLVADGIASDSSECRCFIAQDGTETGTIGPVTAAERKQLDAMLESRKPQLWESETAGRAVFLESIEPDHVLYLFGAGHICTFLAPLAKLVGFRVAVIDDREEFANPERFPNADEIIVGPFVDAFDRISISANAYIAIVTRGHLHDRDVLKAALQTDAIYIGMIGSRRKRNIIYQSLMEEGVSEARLKEVHSPIGADIGGETPEEIAISIVAELISERSSVQNSKR